MTTLREQQATALATAIFPHLETYAEEHGASATVVDGLWALAFLAAYLICSRGVNPDIARIGFLHALDYAIATAPPLEDDKCTLN